MASGVPGVFGLPSGEKEFEGSWSATPFTPSTPQLANGPWLYSSGNVNYQLTVTGSDISGGVIAGTQNKTYPADSKSAILTLEQKTGVRYVFQKSGFWSGNGKLSSDDGTQYSNVAAFRAAHSSISTPLCLATYDVSALVYFDSTMHAAGMVYSSGICNPAVKNTDKITAVQSGVVTLESLPFITVQIPDTFFYPNSTSRDKQVLAVAGLDSIAGNPMNGVAYLPGYAKTNTGYSNQVAFKAWLATVTTDAEANTLP